MHFIGVKWKIKKTRKSNHISVLQDTHLIWSTVDTIKKTLKWNCKHVKSFLGEAKVTMVFQNSKKKRMIACRLFDACKRLSNDALTSNMYHIYYMTVFVFKTRIRSLILVSFRKYGWCRLIIIKQKKIIIKQNKKCHHIIKE